MEEITQRTDIERLEYKIDHLSVQVAALVSFIKGLDNAMNNMQNAPGMAGMMARMMGLGNNQ